MNRFRQFQRLVGTERRAIVTVNSVRADGTSVVETPEGRIMRVRNAPGLGIPAGSKGYVRIRPGSQPELFQTAVDLPLVQFTNL